MTGRYAFTVSVRVYVRKSFTIGTPCCAELGEQRDRGGPGPGVPRAGIITASSTDHPIYATAGHCRAPAGSTFGGRVCRRRPLGYLPREDAGGRSSIGGVMIGVKMVAFSS